ncbi:acyltransferase family protein [Tianweitania sp.]|uniref:acyltransferase family protein n=1 Tax=Tianweitania sp. TaxID=2021634 RepID=UPI00289C5A9E|nr:acyltransferase family protein [Tianweitania sp.]
MRVVMALLVVALHGQLFKEISAEAKFVISDTLSRLAVPWFLVVTGFYFRASSLAELRVWLIRMAVIYAVWMIAYSPFYLADLNLKSAVLLAGFGYRHLWYLFAALQAGPILYCLRGRSFVLLLPIASVLFAIGMVIQHFELTESADYRVVLFRNFLFFALPFMLLGHLMRRVDWKRVSSSLLVLLCVAGCCILLLEAAFFSSRTWFSQDLYVSLFFVSPAVFALCLHFDNGRLRSAAEMATGIYLIHLMVLLTTKSSTSLTETPATLVTIGLSVAAAFALRKLNKLVPVL